MEEKFKSLSLKNPEMSPMRLRSRNVPRMTKISTNITQISSCDTDNDLKNPS